MQISHNDFIDDITGVLLAGGKSRRMGYDKAYIEVNGQSLLSISLQLLCHYFATVLIAGDQPDLARPDIPVIADIYPGSALGGLYTGLRAADTDWIFVAPCDMPHPDPRILELLVKHRNSFDAVVPRTPEGYEPVFASTTRTACSRWKRCCNRVNIVSMISISASISTISTGSRCLMDGNAVS